MYWQQKNVGLIFSQRKIFRHPQYFHNLLSINAANICLKKLFMLIVDYRQTNNLSSSKYFVWHGFCLLFENFYNFNKHRQPSPLGWIISRGHCYPLSRKTQHRFSTQNHSTSSQIQHCRTYFKAMSWRWMRMICC